MLNPGRYQRLYFRNANHPISRPSVVTRRQDRPSSANIQARNLLEHSESEPEKKYVFGAVTADLQLKNQEITCLRWQDYYKGDRGVSAL